MTDAMTAVFARSEPGVRAIYDRILAASRDLGPVAEEPKATSIHLVAGSAFAGVHPKKDRLRLNLVTTGKIDSPRVRKTERVSANRWHNEVDIASPEEIDPEVLGWLNEAYRRSAQRGR
jgi:hypothetical protein